MSREQSRNETETEERRGTRLEYDDPTHCKKCGWELEVPEQTSNGLCEKCNAEARRKVVVLEEVI